MTSKQRIADIILDRAAQGDLYAQEVVRMSDKPREINCTNVDMDEIKPHLLPFLMQEKNYYFTASALNKFIFNNREADERFKDNLYWTRGCVKLLTSIFGEPISRNRWNTRLCGFKWNRKIGVYPPKI